MMYMFPRQFGLHNVFTSAVDHSKTAQKFHDYTIREDEIAEISRKSRASKNGLPKLPKRLRGSARELVQKLRTLHTRCSYNQLLRHYCPSSLDKQRRYQPCKKSTRKSVKNPSVTASQPQASIDQTNRSTERQSEGQTPPKDTDIVEMATPIFQVSAFCQAVLSKIIPNAFWGDGDIGSQNKAAFLRKVDHFIRLRRFETMSLFEISQDIKVWKIRLL